MIFFFIIVLGAKFIAKSPFPQTGHMVHPEWFSLDGKMTAFIGPGGVLR